MKSLPKDFYRERFNVKSCENPGKLSFGRLRPRNYRRATKFSPFVFLPISCRIAFSTMRATDSSVFKKPSYRKISFCRKGGSFLKAVFASLLSANARLSIGCIGTIRGSGSNSIFTRAKSPKLIPAPRLIGVLRYNLHAPWYFTIVCLNLFPFNVPLTGRGPFVLPDCLNNACKTFQEC